MSKKDEYALVGKAMMEPDFRNRLLNNPEQTVKAEGLEVSGGLMDQLRGLDRAAADQVSRLIASIFGQGSGELSDGDLDAVAGGTGPALAAAPKTTSTTVATSPQVQVVTAAPKAGIPQAPIRAPTTW